MAIHVTAGSVCIAKPLNLESYKRRISLVIQDSPNYRTLEFNLCAYFYGVLNSREPADVGLVRVALPSLDDHPLKVEAAVRILQRRIIQEYGLHAVDKAHDGAVGDQVEDAPLGHTSQGVWSLTRYSRTLLLASAPCTRDQLTHPAYSSAKIPPLTTILPTSSRPYPRGTATPCLDWLVGPLNR